MKPRVLQLFLCCSTLASSSFAVAQMGQDPIKAPADALKRLEPKSLPTAPAPAPAADPQADMQALMQASQPGDMHKLIATLAGTWKATVKLLMPGAPPDSSGVMTTTMVLGGRYAHSMFKADLGGMEFEGAATLGFNNVTGKFESTWIDSMGTFTLFSTGSYDKDTKALTMTGEFSDPMSKQTVKQREVLTWVTDTTLRDEFYQAAPGSPETKIMQIDYVKAPATGSPAIPTTTDAAKDQGMKKAQDAMDKAKLPGMK